MLTFFLQRCKGSQSVAVADAYKDRREACARMIRGTAYRDFREILARPDIDAVVVATPDHWHVPIAIAAAPAKKDAYVEKPLGVGIEQDLACLKVFRKTIASSNTARCSGAWPIAVSAASWSAADGSARSTRSKSSRPTAGRAARRRWSMCRRTWTTKCGAAPRPSGPTRPTAAIPTGPTGSTTIRSATSAAGAPIRLDIMVWGSDADIAGPMTVQGTGKVPTEGLYDTVYDWDMQIEMADGVKMTFKPGNDSTKFIGPDGWVRIWRGGIDAEPKSLLKLEDRPKRRTPHQKLPAGPKLHRLREVAQADREPGGPRRPQRHDQPAVRPGRPLEPENHLGPEDLPDRRRPVGTPRVADAVEAVEEERRMSESVGCVKRTHALRVVVRFTHPTPDP